MEITDTCVKELCKEVTQFDDNIVKIVKQMYKKMHQWRGIGLAANQVGIPYRIFVMKAGRTKYTCINPKIIRATAEVEYSEEGCLSVPNKKVKVWRRKQVSIEYRDEHGREHYQGFTGLEAHCVQHEMDHLNGILITDYKHE